MQREPYCFIVLVDAMPVLRCTERRDALRYAVLVRRALLRADRMKKDRFPTLARPIPSKIPH